VNRHGLYSELSYMGRGRQQKFAGHSNLDRAFQFIVLWGERMLIKRMFSAQFCIQPIPQFRYCWAIDASSLPALNGGRVPSAAKAQNLMLDLDVVF